MPLINCEISIMLTWSKKYFLATGTAANQKSTSTIADKKLYFPVLTL